MSNMAGIEKEKMVAYIKDADDDKQKELLRSFRTINLSFEIERRGVNNEGVIAGMMKLAKEAFY